MKENEKIILQFKIKLLGTKVWRTIQVPATYNFYEFHIAINDAMGWFDYHIHEFYVSKDNQKGVRIGKLDSEEPNVLSNLEISISDYFQKLGQKGYYIYDFGANWEHEITLVGMLLKEGRKKLPKCIDGKYACPPEDSGGIDMFKYLLGIIEDPKHEEYDFYIDWLKNHYITNYYPYKYSKFNPKTVVFDDPKERLVNN